MLRNNPGGKVDPIGFADGFYVGMREREEPRIPKAFSLGRWQDGSTSSHVRKDKGGFVIVLHI